MAVVDLVTISPPEKKHDRFFETMIDLIPHLVSPLRPVTFKNQRQAFFKHNKFHVQISIGAENGTLTEKKNVIAIPTRTNIIQMNRASLTHIIMLASLV